MRPDLLPCPFCGGEAKSFLENSCDCCGGRVGVAFCLHCGAEHGHHPTEADAIAAWNRRGQQEQSND